MATDQSAPLVRQTMEVGEHGLAINTLDELWRLAQYVCESGLAPKGMDKPATILIAMQHGMEIGLRPMQSVQSIAVINGRPTIWGDAALALIESSPLCKQVTERVDGTGDNIVATCVAERVGKAPVTRTFSVDDAKKSGLWAKPGPWQQYPKRMLQLRARGFALRDAFPDLLRGIKTAEEVMDYGDGAPVENDRTAAFKAAPPAKKVVAEVVDVAPPDAPQTTDHPQDAPPPEALFATPEEVAESCGTKKDPARFRR